MATSSSRSPRRTGTTPPTTPKVQTGGRPWYRRWWALLLVFPAILAGLLGLLLFFLLFSRIPLPGDLDVGQTVVLDAAGDEVGTLSSDQSRREVDVTDLPDHVRDAVLAAEDRRFYDHNGVSVRGIARALVSNARSGDLTGQGGSTITQQYVKNALLTADQTLSRKLKEAALSIKVERAYSKDEILSFYLSTIYWGRGTNGIESASRTYFGVSAAELTVSQAATLAGIIRSPENLDPEEEPEAAEGRRQFVLDGMLDQGWITDAEHADLVAEGLPAVSGDDAISSQGPAAYYLDAVRRELGPILGDAALYSGLTIRTALIPKMQAAAQTAVSEAVAAGEYDSGALVAIDPATGGVVAAVGGPDFGTQQLNLVTQGSNQVGSAFKPITLARWVTDGYSPQSVFPAPETLTVGDKEFRNYGGESFGKQTLHEATVTSTNTVYVAAQQEMGSREVIDTAIALGLPSERSDGTETMRPTAGLTLGQDGFTVTEVAGVYATLAAEGVRRTPHLTTEVRDRDGVVLHAWEDDAVEALTPNVAAIVTDVLVDVVREGTGTKARIDGRAVAGKTGTTNDNKDAWFGGYTPQLAAAVWVGNLDDTPTDGLTGGGTAAPVWQAFAAAALDGAEVLDFPSFDLKGLEVLRDEPEECPDGYTRREAPEAGEADAEAAPLDGGPQGDGAPAPFVPDVIEDDEELPCVQDAPSPAPSPSPSPTPSPTPSPSPSPSPIASTPPTPKPKPTKSPLPLPTSTPSPSPSPTPTPTPTPTEEPPPDEPDPDPPAEP